MTSREAARRLGTSERWVRELARRGTLRARQLPDGTWLVDSSGLNAFARMRTSSGRNWSSVASWALLAELEGHRLAGLTDRTRARVRRRIRDHDANEIARRVADRTTWSTFTTDATGAVRQALALTGRSVGDALDDTLVPTLGVIEGYIPPDPGIVEALQRDFLLVPDADGTVRIGTRPAGWQFDGRAPASVVAADLAMSTASRDRAAGLATLGELRQRWLANSTRSTSVTS